MNNNQQNFVFSCHRCGIHLPLRHPNCGEQGKFWECTNCGCIHDGLIDFEARTVLLSNISPQTKDKISVE